MQRQETISRETQTPHNVDIPSCLQFFLQQLDNLMTLSNRIGLFGQFNSNKTLINKISFFKEKIAYFYKTQEFENVDTLVLNTFKEDSIEKFRSSYYANFGPSIPLLKNMANTHIFCADLIEQNQKASLESIFKRLHLNNNDEKTTCIRLLLLIQAELMDVTTHDKPNSYKELLEENFDRFIGALKNDQLKECLDNINPAAELARKLMLTKLSDIFQTVNLAMTQTLNERQKNTISLSD